MTSIARDERFWDRLARKYARNPVGDLAGYEKTLERTRSLLHANGRVLEIGCGTGTTALKLASGVAHYTATDISGEMIAIAKEKAAETGAANVVFEKATLDDPQLLSGSFDAVLGFNVLHLVDDLSSALARIRGLLKPGGQFISKTPCIGDMNIFIRLALPVMRFFGKAPGVTVFTAGELERAMTDAGFDIVESARHATKGKDIRPFIVARRR